MHKGIKDVPLYVHILMILYCRIHSLRFWGTMVQLTTTLKNHWTWTIHLISVLHCNSSGRSLQLKVCSMHSTTTSCPGMSRTCRAYDRLCWNQFTSPWGQEHDRCHVTVVCGGGLSQRGNTGDRACCTRYLSPYPLWSERYICPGTPIYRPRSH